MAQDPGEMWGCLCTPAHNSLQEINPSKPFLYLVDPEIRSKTEDGEDGVSGSKVDDTY